MADGKAAIARLRARGWTDEEIANFGDPYWRLTCGKIYKIINKAGDAVPFIPTPWQERELRRVYIEKKRKLAKPKARQMGFSTLYVLMMLDDCEFNDNIKCAIVDRTQADASAKLAKAAFAYKNMPPEFRQKLVNDSGTELGFANGSLITAGMHARGDTFQWLLASELGVIAHEEPSRADEIKTGAFPAAEKGIIIVESTAKGGKRGLFWELIKRGRDVTDKERTAKDFWVSFTGWWENVAEYSLEGDLGRIQPDVHEYLDKVEKECGVKLTDGQRLWYAVTKEEQGIFMKQEYPSTIDECFEAPIQGAIYAELLLKAWAQGRIYDFAPDAGWSIFTAWDIGYSDTTDIWFFQLRGNRLDILRHMTWKGAGAPFVANELMKLGIDVAAHYLPHDVNSKHANTATSYFDELRKAGMRRLKVVPRTPDIWIGINYLRQLFPRISINASGCKTGLEALEAYRSQDERDEGKVVSVPVHDWSSHAADGLRTMAEAIRAGMVDDGMGKFIDSEYGENSSEGKLVSAFEGYGL